MVNSYIDLNKLIFKLKPVEIEEIQYAETLKFPIYLFKSGYMQPITAPGNSFSKDQFMILKKNGISEVFLHQDDFDKLKENVKSLLTKISRSLSIGDPVENGQKEITLLSKNLINLYNNPHDDEALKLHYQSSQNLAKFLIENKKYQSEIFQNSKLNQEHFIAAQPMESSILLTAFLQQIKIFNNNEIENLFLTSYLKDIGLSLIPKEKYNSSGLSERERELFSNHSNFSKDLLVGRIPLTTNYINIIKNHHFLNNKLKKLIGKESDQNDEVIIGLETTLVAVFDMLVAMTNERPYRKKLTMFQALEIIKKLMSDDYPQEYKAIIIFINQFFKN